MVRHWGNVDLLTVSHHLRTMKKRYLRFLSKLAVRSSNTKDNSRLAE